MIEQGRLDRAVRTLDRADQACPAERSQSWGALASALAELGQLDRARKLTSEIESAPNASQADRDAAREAKRLSDEQAAPMADTDEARKPMRDRMEAGDQAWRAGQFEAARTAYLEAWKLWHPNPTALAQAARCSLELKQRPQAQRLFDRALFDARKSSGALKLEEQNAILGTTRIAWSRDGDTIAMAHGDAVTVLDGKTLVQRGPVLRGHTQKINAVALSGDGKMIASAASDGTIRLWDAVGFKPIRKLVANANIVHAVAFSPDGKLLASDSNHLVRLWDVYTARVKDTIKGHREAVNAIAFTADGSKIASGTYDNTIGLWDTRSAGYLRRFYREGLPGSSIAFSPDGKLLAANTARFILLWDVESGKVDREMGTKEWADYLAFHPAGKLLASASTGASSDRLIRLWDVSNGQVVRELKGHTGDPTAIAFSPDGKLVASGSDDRTVMFWDTESGRLVQTVQRAVQRISSVSFSADGHSLAAVAGEDRLVVFNLEDGKVAQTIPAKATSAVFRADGTVVASDSRDRALRVVDVTGGKLSKEIPFAGAAGPGVVAWTQDRKKAAVASADNTISLIDVESGQVVTKLKDTDRAHAIAFSPDGKMLAVGAGYQDKAVRVWDVDTGKITRKLPGHKDRSTAIAFSPDGRFLASGSEDRTVQLWDAKHWPPARPLQTPSGAITSLAFNQDGTLLAAGSEDSIVRVWDPAAGKVVRELTGHDAAVRSVAFSADGALLATAGEHGAIRLWAASDGAHLATLRLAGGDAWYVFAQAQGDSAGWARIGGGAEHDAEQYLACRFGAIGMPFDICRDHVLAEHFLGAVLKRQAAAEE